MRVEPLMEEQVAASGFTHRATIEYSDFTAAATTQTFQLLNDLPRGTMIRAAAFELETAFDGGATSSLVMDVGYDLLAGTDDPDAFLDGYEVHADGTEILGGDGNGAVFATLRTGYVALEELDLEVLFTATGANVTALTSGKVHIYLAVCNLAKLR